MPDSIVPGASRTALAVAWLRAAGVDPAVPVFFSWLGGRSDIGEEAADALLQRVSSCPASSEIVLTFAPRDPLHLVRTADAVASIGEPWRTFIDADELVARLRGFGFHETVLLSPAEAAARYVVGRTDGLEAPRRTTIAAAVV